MRRILCGLRSCGLRELCSLCGGLPAQDGIARCLIGCRLVRGFALLCALEEGSYTALAFATRCLHDANVLYCCGRVGLFNVSWQEGVSSLELIITLHGFIHAIK
jgi:hypothetical protein